MRSPDLSGSRFSRWLVIRRAEKPRYWVCKCDCGVERPVSQKNLRNGMSRSCGCLSLDAAKARAIHGMSRHPLHNVWLAMKNRCHLPTDQAFKHYGGRGISVCERWRESFVAFYEDMGEGWAPGLSIERRDNDGDYEPSNCIWIPRSEQAKNRRSVIYLDTPKGRMSRKQASREFGISVNALVHRMANWPPERWLEPPNQKYGRRPA